MDDEPLSFTSIAGFRQWLRRNHGREGGVWVLLSKKGTPGGITYLEALDEALCWGWIDGKIHARDARYFAQWFSPRRKTSIWSLANRKRVERLKRDGRMRPPGLERVREAQESGRWNKAYATSAPPRMKADVRRALEAAGHRRAWEGLAPSHRLMLLHWIEDAKKPETRAKRLAELPVLVRERRLAGFAAPKAPGRKKPRA